MIKHFKRLKEIADFVPENARIIDVGCDHGYLDIYLTKEKNCICLAADISENSIDKAKNNFKKYNIYINTIVTNGLENIKLNDEIIILAGLGTHTILKILHNDIKNDLIISSNNNLPYLREKLYEKGYYIYKDKNILDDRYYNITYFKYGKKEKINFYLGKDLHNKDYLKYLYNKYDLKNKYDHKYNDLLKEIKEYIKNS